MKPTLVPNWKKVVRHSWSIRLLALAGVLSGAEAALPLLSEYFVEWKGWFALATPLVIGAAFVARLLAQKTMQEEDDGDEE